MARICSRFRNTLLFTLLQLSSLQVLVKAAAISSAPGLEAQPWRQCGGIGYSGAVLCPEGYTCNKVNDVYHQCILQDTLHDEVKRSEPEDQVPEKRQAPQDVYPITGVTSSCSLRQNIEVLLEDYPDQFNMFILAVNDIQQNPGEDRDLSWFGIAGIHGEPAIPWKQSLLAGQFTKGKGYCIHGSPLFSTWHRAYLMLWEQVLQTRAVAIANKFTGEDREKYIDAANQLRLPYFDWSDSAYGRGLPTSVTVQYIDITRPSSNGRSLTEPLRNPLYMYNFASTERTQFSGNRFKIWRSTTRDPPITASINNPIPFSRNGDVSRSMISSFATRRQTTSNLFSMKAFTGFASQLESIHNSIHHTIGGDLGHMGEFVVAAFDPIFLLHHCQTDRLTAMYQAIHPENRFGPVPAVETFGRVVNGRNETDDLNTPLSPFRKPDGTMYTSRDFFPQQSPGIWGHGYGYPEIPCNSGGRDYTKLSRQVGAAVQELYGPISTPTKRRRAAESLPEALPGPGSTKQCVCDCEVGLVRAEYNLRLFIDHSEIPGSWACHIFFGTVPDKPADYWTSPNRCGIFASFAAPGDHARSMPFTYDLAITDKLLDLGVEQTEAAVTAYLKKNLNYSIIGHNGCIIDLASLKTFKVGVCTREGTYGKQGTGRIASFGDCRLLLEVTENKPGGCTNEKELDEPSLLDGTLASLLQKLGTY